MENNIKYQASLEYYLECFQLNTEILTFAENNNITTSLVYSFSYFDKINNIHYLRAPKSKTIIISTIDANIISFSQDLIQYNGLQIQITTQVIQKPYFLIYSSCYINNEITYNSHNVYKTNEIIKITSLECARILSLPLSNLKYLSLLLINLNWNKACKISHSVETIVFLYNIGTIPPNIMPPFLKKLKFKGSFSGLLLNILPNTLQKLSINHYKQTIKDGDLPQSLIKLTLKVYEYEIDMGILPKSLKIIKLPANLKTKITEAKKID